MIKPLFLLQLAAMWSCLRRSGVAAFTSPMGTSRRNIAALQMSTTTTPKILPRIKTIDATEPTDGPVLVKGWVRTVRKQKTLTFIEVNDGSNMGGLQCVLSFDAIDDATREGMENSTTRKLRQSLTYEFEI
jgi:hypothetical protein